MKPEYKVFSKLSCNPCAQAEQLLKDHNQNYTKLILDQDFDIIELYNNVPKSVRTFPAILKDGVFIGGLPHLIDDLAVTSNDEGVVL